MAVKLVYLKAFLRGVKGLELLALASLALSISIPFIALSSSLSSVIEAMDSGVCTDYVKPIPVVLNGRHYVSMICYRDVEIFMNVEKTAIVEYSGGGEGIILPIYLKEVYSIGDEALINASNNVLVKYVIGFYSSNASRAVMISSDCKHVHVSIDSYALFFRKTMHEVRSLAWIMGAVSLLTCSLVVALDLIKNRDSVIYTLSTLRSSGYSKSSVLTCTVISSILLGFITAAASFSIGLYTTHFITLTISRLAGLTIVKPYVGISDLTTIFITDLLSFTTPFIAFVIHYVLEAWRE